MHAGSASSSEAGFRRSTTSNMPCRRTTMTKSEFVYTTYIKTTPEKLWNALTNTEFMKQYWFGALCLSDWKAGSPWKLCFPDGEVADMGEIVESIPSKRLVI